MMTPRPRALALLGVVLATGACVSVKPVVFDRQTQLENQILGRLLRLERELVLASSVRGDAPASAPAGPLAREAATAAMNRAFNADDIARLKRAGLVGEARGARLALLNKPKKARAAQLARALVAEENRDRATLMRRVIQLSPDLSARDLPLVRRLFHELLLRTARAGERVQRDDGRWVTVAKGASS